MKGKLIIIYVVLAALAAAGRAAQDADGRAKVAEVVGFDWKYQGYASAETIRDESGTGSVKARRGIAYLFKYTARLSLKNLSEKTIRAVEWNYIFTEPASEKELKRYKLFSKQQILPGETQTLARAVLLDLKEDTRHFSSGKQKILLTRIEYTDGTSWRP